MDALVAGNVPPGLFVRQGAIVRVRRDEQEKPLIERANEAVIRHILARSAEFQRVRGTTNVPADPPSSIAQDILALGSWPLPAIEAITEVPVLRPDGTVLEVPGYDPAMRLLYCPAPALTIDPVPPDPTVSQLKAALEVLSDIFGDFAFVDEAGSANALALVMTPVIRPAIPGPVPLALIDKPKRGTGATLLVNVVQAITTGRTTDLMTAPRDDEEWRKKITAALLAGLTFLFFDNVDHPLSSPSLAAALTTREWSDRMLGRTEMITVAQRATWVATGNNLQVGGDIGRRSYWIRLDAGVARPWRRTGFRHPKLLEHALSQRGQILTAILTLARGWFAAGRPKATVPTIGSFEDWAETLGGVLGHVGVTGFLSNLDGLYEMVDEEEATWEGFLAAWDATYGPKLRTVAEIHGDLQKDVAGTTPLRQALPPELVDALTQHAGGFTRRLGKALAKRAGAVIGELKLEKTGTAGRNKTQGWRVIKASSEPPHGGFPGFPGFVPSAQGSVNDGNGLSTEGREPGAPVATETNPPNPPNPARGRTCRLTNHQRDLVVEDLKREIRTRAKGYPGRSAMTIEDAVSYLVDEHAITYDLTEETARDILEQGKGRGWRTTIRDRGNGGLEEVLIPTWDSEP